MQLVHALSHTSPHCRDNQDDLNHCDPGGEYAEHENDEC